MIVDYTKSPSAKATARPPPGGGLKYPQFSDACVNHTLENIS